MDGRMPGSLLAREPGDPRRLGPYELVGRLGEGGMGVVFLGRERRGGRLAAVKALRPELSGDPGFAARFRREADAAARVDSPRVARVLGADSGGARPWLATEYVAGPTLAQSVAAGGPLAGELLVGFATGAAEALTAIHAAGVVHRDLKPSNVLLERRPVPPTGLGADHPAAQPGLGPARPGTGRADRPGVKVIDFGIASAAGATLTRSGLRFGTPSWMAPEQLRDLPVGPATDVFAWGALVAFAATGRHPFGGGPADAVGYRILHDRPDLTGVPGSLRRLVQSALSTDPAARPAAAEVAAALAATIPPTLPLPASSPTTRLPAAPPRPGRPRRRRRVGRLLVVLALLAGLVTAPHVVLAAVRGGDDDTRPATAKHCPSAHQDHDEGRPAEVGDREDADEESHEDEREEADTERADEDDDGRPPAGGDDPAPAPPALTPAPVAPEADAAGGVAGS